VTKPNFRGNWGYSGGTPREIAPKRTSTFPKPYGIRDGMLSDRSFVNPSPDWRGGDVV